MSDKDSYYIDLEDEVVRGSIILHNGKLLWPPPPPKEIPVVAAPKEETKLAKAPPKELLPADYFRATLKDAMIYTAGLSMSEAYLFIYFFEKKKFFLKNIN
jgi:NAD(P) transhydrogenase